MVIFVVLIRKYKSWLQDYYCNFMIPFGIYFVPYAHSWMAASTVVLYFSKEYYNSRKNITLEGKFHLCIPFLGIAWPQSQFPHSCVCERFIYSQDRFTYFPVAEKADWSWKYINLSQIYECRNWATEHYSSVLEITFSFLGILTVNGNQTFILDSQQAFICSV
jgi:hypothetical protein